jgi:hypothetical protein
VVGLGREVSEGWCVLSYAAIAQQLVDASRSRGFAATTWEDFPIRLRGMDREIGELVEAMKAGDVAEMSLESADVVAYAIILLKDLGNTQWHFRRGVQIKPPVYADPAVMVEPLRAYSDKAYEAWRVDAKVDAFISLELVIAHVADLRTRCLRLPNELHFDLQLAMAKNRGRATRHGGKEPRS